MLNEANRTRVLITMAEAAFKAGKRDVAMVYYLCAEELTPKIKNARDFLTLELRLQRMFKECVLPGIGK